MPKETKPGTSSLGARRKGGGKRKASVKRQRQYIVEVYIGSRGAGGSESFTRAGFNSVPDNRAFKIKSITYEVAVPATNFTTADPPVPLMAPAVGCVQLNIMSPVEHDQVTISGPQLVGIMPRRHKLVNRDKNWWPRDTPKTDLIIRLDNICMQKGGQATKNVDIFYVLKVQIYLSNEQVAESCPTGYLVRFNSDHSDHESDEDIDRLSSATSLLSINAN